MKITRIEAKRVPLDLTRPYTIAYKTVSAVEICILEVETESGLLGLGAANPSPYVVGEDMDACMAALAPDRVEKFLGRDVRDLRRLCQDLHETYPENPGAKAALDLAFHDLFAQHLGVPLLTYLGQYHEKMATSITIGIKNVADTLEEAQEYIDRQFKILKVKLGHSLEEDLERLIKLRERFGAEIGIRVDANQGYTTADLVHFHQATQALKLELVEQPLPVGEEDAIRGLNWEIRKTIAADESLVTADHAFQWVSDPKMCGIFNIKLMKCGGIYQAQRIAEAARFAECELMWGCNDESIISITAALHVAFSCPHTRFIDLDGSLDLARDMVEGGFILEDGFMRPNGKPGLGLTYLGV
ncbi:MAG: dipeptide epimerase [Bacteroidota bacterium]